MRSPPPVGKAVFRPSPGMRAISAGMCVLALAVWLTVAVTAPEQRGGRIAAASILALPCLAGSAILFRRIEADDSGISSMTLFGARRVQWADLRRIDVRRGSFVIESNVGPVSAAMLDARVRDPLLRLIVERAALTRTMEDLPWGLESRYVPRRQDIGFAEFVPHNRRTKAQDGERER